MRHLHFTQSLEPMQGGGLGSSCLQLHSQMLAADLSSQLCSTHGGLPQSRVANTREFPRIKPGAIYFSPALQREAPALVREADVLHGHGFYVGTNFIFGREARRQRKPLVYHAHGMFEPYILKRSRWKKNLVQWLFENANFRQVRFWRALTSKEADQIRACGFGQPIVVAPNGLNPDEFPAPSDRNAPLELPLVKHLEKNALRLLFLGRLHPKKGLDILLQAWSKLSTGAHNWQLVIAGPDEQGYYAQVRSLAQSLGVLDQIIFTGPVSGATKVNLLHSADLFVLPSYSEGFSMGILEAMACGLPVVATRACNFPEISQTEAGWECDATAESLTKVLQTALLCSDSERQSRGAKGQQLIQSRYTWPTVIKTLQKACDTYC